MDEKGLRNAISDALALALIDVGASGVTLRLSFESFDELLAHAKGAVLRQSVVQLAVTSLESALGDRSGAARLFADGLDAQWKPASALRNLGGVLRYAAWAGENFR